MRWRTPRGIELVQGARVSDGFFRTLGVAPALGRDFYAGEDLPGKPDTLIISDAAWHARFGGRRDVIGQTVTLSGDASHHRRRASGALSVRARRGAPSSGRRFTRPADATLRRSCHALCGVGRLKDGVTVEEAHAADEAGSPGNWSASIPTRNRGQGASVVPLADVIVGDIRPMLLLLLGGAALLLAIACVNVVSLLLVRSEGRKRELAVRSTLGASNGRLIRQFVTEAFVLVASGSALGLLFASSAVQLLFGLISEDMRARMPYLDGVGMNAARSGLCRRAGARRDGALLAGAGRARALQRAARGAGRGRARLIGQRLAPPRLQARRRWSWRRRWCCWSARACWARACTACSTSTSASSPIAWRPCRWPPRARASRATSSSCRLGREVASRVARLPGVQSVGLVDLLPVSFNGNTNWIRFVGRPYNGEHNEVNSRGVSAGYFTTVRATAAAGTRLHRQRHRRRASRRHHQPDAGEEVLPGEDPIGKRYGDTSLTPPSMKEIVGIVDDIREGRARLGDLAGRVRAVRAGSGHLLHRRRAHLADRGVGAAGDERRDSRHRSRRGHQARRRHARPHRRLAVRLSPAVVGVAGRRLRRARAAARHRRPLRRRRLLGEPAHA